MKRFILFLSIFFYTFISSKLVLAQQVDSVVVTVPILCPGDEATIDIYSSSIGAGPFRMTIFAESGQPAPFSAWNWAGSVPIPPNVVTFGNGTNMIGPGLFSGNYMAVISDPSWNPTGGTNDFSDPAIVDTFAFTIYPAVPILVNATQTSDNLCPGDCIASDSIAIIGGQGPYTVTLTTGGVQGPAISLGPTVSHINYGNLCADSYEVLVVDANQCQQTQTFTISEPPILDPLGATGSYDSTSITCPGANDGTLGVNPNGGTPPYTFEWFDISTGTAFPTGQTTQTIDSLAPGCYFAIITDANGCDTISDTLCLVDPQALTIGPVVQTLFIDCNGNCNAQITTTIVDPGAGPNHTFTILNNPLAPPFPSLPQSDSTFSNLCAGDYQIVLTDANGCTDTSNVIQIDQPDPITFNIDTFSYVGGFGFSCKDSCDGVITINNILGGNGPPYFENLWLAGGPISNGTVFDSLCWTDGSNGQFSYEITDTLGCIGTASITLTEPDVLDLDPSFNTLNFITCPGACDGEIQVTATGGGIPINYYLDGILFATDNPSVPVQTGQQVCGIETIGIGTILASNANGCFDTIAYFLSEPQLLDLNLDSINENCGLDNGEVNATMTGGTPPYTYSWTGPATWAAGPSVINGPTPLGFDNIVNLTRGVYTLQVTDNAGCVVIDSIEVDTAYIDVLTTPMVQCNDSLGVIILENKANALTGTPNPLDQLVWATDTLLSQILPGYPVGPFTKDTLTGLTSGWYHYEVQLAGCNPTRDSVFIGPSTTFDASLDTTLSDLDLLCFGDLTDSIFVRVVDSFGIQGSSPYFNPIRYDIIPITAISNPLSAVNISATQVDTSINVLNPQAGTVFPSQPFGIYQIIVTSNQVNTNGQFNHLNCIDTVDVTVIQPDSLQFTLDSVHTQCFGDSTGAVYVNNIFGGNQGQYVYTWTDANGTVLNPLDNTLDSIGNLPSGWYTLSVQDTLLCPQSLTIDSIFITQPPIISVLSIDTVQVDFCAPPNYNNTGALSISAAGGTGAYTYSWTTSSIHFPGGPSSWSETLPNIGNLYTGMYYVTITDANGCSISDSAFVPDGVDPLVHQGAPYINHVTCNGFADGSYIAVVDSLNPLGSNVGPFTFIDANGNQIPTPQANPTGPVVVPVRIVDGLGCLGLDTIIITQPDSLIIQNVAVGTTAFGGWNVSCNGYDDGWLDIDIVTGGTFPYNYSIQGIQPGSVIETNLDLTDHLFDTITAGWYYCNVTDFNGCVYQDSVYLHQPDSLLIDSVPMKEYIGGWSVSCNGFTDGAAAVYTSGGTAGSNPDSLTYSYTYTWSNGNTTQFTDTTLAPNTTYSILVEDVHGCKDSVDITTGDEPTPLVINNITKHDLLCIGGDRGDATVFASGATPDTSQSALPSGYSYLWNNGNSTIPTYINPSITIVTTPDTTATADTLREGWYTVHVWDVNGCHISDSVHIDAPQTSIEIHDLIVVQMTCANYNDASVDIVAHSGNADPWHYSVYHEITLDTVADATALATQGNIGFAGLSTSYISAGGGTYTPASYVAIVQDTLDPMPAHIALLDPSRQHGCVARDSFEIYPLDSVYIAGIIDSNVSCHGYDDGYIVDITNYGGGIPPYLFSVDGGTQYSSWIDNNGDFVFSGLAPGNYTVEIWDSAGCVNSDQITITEPSPLNVSISTNNYNNYQIACNGDTDTAFVVVSGGVSPYEITWDWQSSTNTVTGIISSVELPGILAGPNVEIIITDNFGNGCEEVHHIAYNEPPLLQIDMNQSMVDSVSCNGVSNGSISAFVTGGPIPLSGPIYQYQWFTGTTAIAGNEIIGETNYWIDNLPAGDYTLEVTDANGCKTEATWDLGANLLMILPEGIPGTQIIDASCNAFCDGEIAVAISGGVAPYDYLWDDPGTQNTSTAVGLCAGTYTCIVTDATGCSYSMPFDIEQPDELITNISLAQAILCNGDANGKLKALSTGGTLPYTFTWSTGTSVTPPSPATSHTEDGLSVGLYTVFVEDANGCTDTAEYDLEQPTIITLEDSILTHVQCKGGSDGTIQIDLTGGTPYPGIGGIYEFTLKDENGNIIPTSPQLSAMGSWSGLPTGLYHLTATDQNYDPSNPNVCMYEQVNIFIDEPTESLQLSVVASNGTCENPNTASLVGYPSGGTLPYTYNWTADPNNTTNYGIIIPDMENVTIDNISAYESYILSIEDANGCKIGVKDQVRGYNNIFLPGYDSTLTESLCYGEELNIDVEECDGCSYEWQLADGTIISSSSDLSIITDSSWLPLEILTLQITEGTCVNENSKVTTNFTELHECPPSSTQNAKPGDVVTLGGDIPNNNPSWTYQWTNSKGEDVSAQSEFTYEAGPSECFDVVVSDGTCISYCNYCVAVGSNPFDAFSPNGDGYNDTWWIDDIQLFDGSTVQIYNRWGELVFEQTNCSNDCWDGKIDGKDAPVGTYYYIIDHNDGSDVLTGPITLVR